MIKLTLGLIVFKMCTIIAISTTQNIYHWKFKKESDLSHRDLFMAFRLSNMEFIDLENVGMLGVMKTFPQHF